MLLWHLKANVVRVHRPTNITYTSTHLAVRNSKSAQSRFTNIAQTCGALVQFIEEQSQQLVEKVGMAWLCAHKGDMVSIVRARSRVGVRAGWG